MLREIFIGLSTSRALRAFAEHSPLGQKVSRRFVAGTTVEDLLAAAEAVNQRGMSVSVDHLGENVTNAEEARQSAQDYHRLLDLIAQRGLVPRVHLAGVPLVSAGFAIEPYRVYAWGRPKPVRCEPLGDELRCREMRFDVLHTPGHSHDHVCLFEPEPFYAVDSQSNLLTVDDAPQLPAGYPAMVLVALVPPLWFAVMDPRVPVSV